MISRNNPDHAWAYILLAMVASIAISYFLV